MAYSAPTTRSTGFLVTAAVWNQDVVDNMVAQENPPACRVRHNANQTLTTGVDLTILFNTEELDTTGNMHSTSVDTSKIVVPTAGLYHITGTVEIGSSAAGSKRYVYIQVNGTTVIAITSMPFSAGAVSWGNVSTTKKLAAGDYLQLKAHQDSGGNLTLFTDGEFAPVFTAVRVGAG